MPIASSTYTLLGIRYCLRLILLILLQVMFDDTNYTNSSTNDDGKSVKTCETSHSQRCVDQSFSSFFIFDQVKSHSIHLIFVDCDMKKCLFQVSFCKKWFQSISFRYILKIILKWRTNFQLPCIDGRDFVGFADAS